MYKDVLNLKLVIKLLLTKEQFAAIKFCGCNIKVDEQETDSLSEEKIAKNSAIVNDKNYTVNKNKVVSNEFVN